MTPRHSETLLIVDDLATNIKALAIGLKDEYRIQVATTGERALILARSEQPPDLILLDILMPGMDGFTVCRRLKAEERTQNIPIIFITAKGAREDEVHGLELGAVDYITKPFVMPVIKARVRMHLDLKRKNDLLENLAMLDGLTEIHNRRFFNETLEKEWRRNMRSRHHLALILADIDLFKQYNDHYGHTAGDSCLRRVAQIFRETVRRPGDVAARYGGEEFAVLLPEVRLTEAVKVAQAIHDKVSALGMPHSDSPTGVVTISLGVANQVPIPNSSPLELVRAADAMLYQAKDRGRNQVRY